MSSIDTTPLTIDQLKEFPNDCTAALGVKLSPENIVEFVQKFFPNKSIAELDPAKRFNRQFGIDLKNDFIDLLSGDLRGFSSGSIIKPLLVGVVGIKDPKSFESTLEAINNKIKKVQASRFDGEFVEKTGRDGITVYGVKNLDGTSIYWAVVESELLFGSNSLSLIHI